MALKADHPVNARREMTPGQRRFVEEYLVDGNASQAALRAGLSAQHGRRLLQNATVRAAIQSAQEQTSQRLAITADNVLREYARIAFAHVRDVVSWTQDAMTLVGSAELDEDVSAAIKSIKITRRVTKWGENVEQQVTMHDKLSALDQLAKQLGIATDKLDVRVWREEAARVAAELGLDEDEVLRETERLLGLRE
jgi:phage terminase small subunit